MILFHARRQRSAAAAQPHRGNVKGSRWPVEILTPAEVRALLAACPADTIGCRNRALLVVMYRGGLRVSEALALEPRDVDLAAGIVHVRHGKGNRSRRVGLDAGACAVIAAWWHTRSALHLPATAPLFCTVRATRRSRPPGAPLAPGYMRRTLPALGREAGIAKRVHPHALRHTHAAELAQEAVPVDLIRDQLGHSSLATTDRYLRHIAPQQRLAAMRARTWTP